MCVFVVCFPVAERGAESLAYISQGYNTRDEHGGHNKVEWSRLQGHTTAQQSQHIYTCHATAVPPAGLLYTAACFALDYFFFLLA